MKRPHFKFNANGFLNPDFNTIPRHLKKLPRWVVWKNKVPYKVNNPKVKASVTDPSTWGTYESAYATYKIGGFDGIGFVFNGDGIVGIDIDKCYTNGTPSHEALNLLEEFGCGYIEVSPSGTGLHGIGILNNPPRTGRKVNLYGVSIEFYPTSRFFTVTGLSIRNRGIKLLDGYVKVFQSIKNTSTSLCTEVTEVTEDTEATDSISSVDELIIPDRLIPSGHGQRNKKIFELTRYVKGVNPKLTFEESKPYFLTWFELSLDRIKTQDSETSWIDFVNAWDNVKFPAGYALSQLSEMPLPVDFDNKGLQLGAKAAELYEYCYKLQILAGKEPFYLACRTAGNWLDIDYKEASSILRVFRRKDWLKEISKGKGSKASRYRLNI